MCTEKLCDVNISFVLYVHSNKKKIQCLIHINTFLHICIAKLHKIWILITGEEENDVEDVTVESGLTLQPIHTIGNDVIDNIEEEGEGEEVADVLHRRFRTSEIKQKYFHIYIL